jgi:hypothetical protein
VSYPILARWAGHRVIVGAKEIDVPAAHRYLAGMTQGHEVKDLDRLSTRAWLRVSAV